MKKIMSIHLLLIAVMLFANTSKAETPRGAYASRQELKKVRRNVDKQLKKSKREQIQERRERILYNGNINNFYPRVEWIIINNRAYLIFRNYHSYYGYYNRYMRIS